MIPRPPRSTRTDTLVPYPKLSRSAALLLDDAAIGGIEVDLHVLAGLVLAVDLVAIAADLEHFDGVALVEHLLLHRRFGQPLRARRIGALRCGKDGCRQCGGGKEQRCDDDALHGASPVSA